MQSQLFVSCQCGELKATVTVNEKSIPTRLKCYCTDCQTYTGHLEKTEVHLDKHRGTDILQISPAQLRITAGEGKLVNLMLSPNGIYRWYASCCQTPICNTPTKAEMPYVGLLTDNIISVSGHPAGKSNRHLTKIATSPSTNKTLTDENRHALLHEYVGPVKFGVGAGERHPINADWPISKGFGFRGMLSTIRNMAKWRLRGDHTRSGLIDSVSGKPIVEPLILTKKQRQAAEDNLRTIGLSNESANSPK